MDMNPSSKKLSGFSREVLEKVLSLIESNEDRNSVSLVNKDWYNAERWTRTKLFIGNCYSVSPEIVARRFPNVKSVTLQGKPRYASIYAIEPDWRADVKPWILVFAEVYPFMEELRLKRMTVTDESLKLIAKSFPGFKALSLNRCDGFRINGVKAIATNCKNLTELDMDSENRYVDGSWLSCFPENFASLEVLNFSLLRERVTNFGDLERLVSRCKSMRVLKVNGSINLDQLKRLLEKAPQLTELHAGVFYEIGSPTPVQFEELKNVFSNCKNLHTLSIFRPFSCSCLPVLYPACGSLTFLDLSCMNLHRDFFAEFVVHCRNLRKIYVLDTVEDTGLERIASCCALLEEIRVYPCGFTHRTAKDRVTELGLLAVSGQCLKLQRIVFWCWKFSNAALTTVARNRPDLTYFCLSLMRRYRKNHLPNKTMDEGYGAVVQTCEKLQSLLVSGLVTDLTFKYIGKYAKNLETLTVDCAARGDLGIGSVFEGCPKLRELEVKGGPFGDAALLSGVKKYESMCFLWITFSNVTLDACRLLAKELPRLNVEVMKVQKRDESKGYRVYIYPSLAGPRQDAPPFLITF